MDSLNLKAFFQKTGKILYAVAMADKHLTDDEYNIIAQIATRKWDEYGFDSSQKKHLSQLKHVFDYLNKYPQSPDDILDEFKGFKNDNPTLFSEDIKSFVYKTAHEVAASHASKNKSELIVLGKLHLILRD